MSEGEQGRDSIGLISEDEISQLAKLFIIFEGAPDPLSRKCREALLEFNSMIDRLYDEKVKPTIRRYRVTSSEVSPVFIICQRVHKTTSIPDCP
jgi:hypothetical protein